MSITSQVCKRTYAGDGETRSWEVDFPVLSETDITVYVTDLTGQETKIETGYEVNLLTGTVTYPTLTSGLSPLAIGTYVTVMRTTPLTQNITLTQQGVLDASVLEKGFDKLTLQVQELAEQSARSIKYSAASGCTDADAQSFLNELSSAQTTALNNALISVAQTKTEILQALSTEQGVRSEADIALQQSVQTVTGTLAQQDAAQTLALTAETSARTSADNTLQSNLNAEVSARQNADTALDTTKLSKTEAAATYLSQSSASDTYLTKTNASSTYVSLSQKNTANGVATLDSNTLIPAEQLPLIDGGNANA